MKVELDGHHVILYAVLAIVAVVLAGTYHAWRMDLAAAKTKAAEQEQAIAQVQKDAETREKNYLAQIAALKTLKVTPSTPAPVIVTRLANLEPEMAVSPGQLVAPKPDAPKENLVLLPAQQVDLVNRLIDCKTCELERDKLKADLTGSAGELQAMTKERDDWKTAAKGGSLGQRIKRRAWHFLEDAIIIEGLRLAGGHP